MRLRKRDVIDEEPCFAKVIMSGSISAVSGWNTIPWAEAVIRRGGAWHNPGAPTVINIPRSGIYMVTGSMANSQGADLILAGAGNSGDRWLESACPFSVGGGVQNISGLIDVPIALALELFFYSTVAQSIGSGSFAGANLCFNRLGDRL